MRSKGTTSGPYGPYGVGAMRPTVTTDSGKQGGNPEQVPETASRCGWGAANALLKEELAVIAEQRAAVNGNPSGVLTAHHVLGVAAKRRGWGSGRPRTRGETLGREDPQGRRETMSELGGGDWDEVVTR